MHLLSGNFGNGDILLLVQYPCVRTGHGVAAIFFNLERVLYSAILVHYKIICNCKIVKLQNLISIYTFSIKIM
jgi:hypothetical protein